MLEIRILLALARLQMLWGKLTPDGSFIYGPPDVRVDSTQITEENLCKLNKLYTEDEYRHTYGKSATI